MARNFGGASSPGAGASCSKTRSSAQRAWTRFSMARRVSRLMVWRIQGAHKAGRRRRVEKTRTRDSFPSRRVPTDLTSGRPAFSAISSATNVLISSGFEAGGAIAKDRRSRMEKLNGSLTANGGVKHAMRLRLRIKGTPDSMHRRVSLRFSSSCVSFVFETENEISGDSHQL